MTIQLKREKALLSVDVEAEVSHQRKLLVGAARVAAVLPRVVAVLPRNVAVKYTK
jgi:hypothetical protein